MLPEEEPPAERVAQLPAPPIPPVPAPPKEAPDDIVNIPAQRDGQVLMIGTEIKDGEIVPADDIITIKTDGKERRFRRLKVGDKVAEGQLIGLLDDRLARLEVQSRKAKVQAAEADRLASEKTKDVAAEELKRLQRLLASGVVDPQTVHQDGLYWFKVQVIDRDGRIFPKTDELIAGPPDLRVCVDTTAPTARLDTERRLPNPSDIGRTLRV